MQKIAMIEVGMGIDLHGQDVTKASVRAVRDAIGHNSLAGITDFLPGGDLGKLKVHTVLGVPFDKDKVDVEEVKRTFPVGQIDVEVVTGGLSSTSGGVMPEKGDRNDQMAIVIAVIEVGY